MQYSEMKALAVEGSAEDVKVLLSVYGQDKFTFNNETCVDLITASVFESDRDADEKKSLILDYKNKTGVFGNPQEIAPDIAQQFQENLDQLTRVVVHLAGKIEELTQKVEKLSGPAPKKPAPKPGPGRVPNLGRF